MRLAWRNILFDRGRFLVTVLGIAFAVFLMIFQGSLLVGFLGAASKLVDATDSDLWITARGVLCFDFSAPLPKRFAEIAQGVTGVEETYRIATSFAEYRNGEGRHHVVALVGADPQVGKAFPIPRLRHSNQVIEHDAVVIDASHQKTLEIARFPEDVEINRRRAKVLRQVDGFSSFLGSPYVFTSYPDAVDYLGLGIEETNYILIKLKQGYAPQQVKAALQRRLPEVDVWTKQEFSDRSRLYWVTKTGAGAAILTAAVLGFLIGLVVVSQTIYATTMENIEEFATLKALGAGRWMIMRTVLAQSLLCCLAGSALGVAVTLPLVDLAKATIAWVHTPNWLIAAIMPPSFLMCALAALVSIRAAISVEPARVFRA